MRPMKSILIAGVLTAVATQSVAERLAMSVPLAVPSDPKAEYMLLDFEQVLPGLIIATTRRDGPSGVSYSVRVFDCESMRFKYLADGESLAQVRAKAAAAPRRRAGRDLAPLTRGSISYFVARQACAASM